MKWTNVLHVTAVIALGVIAWQLTIKNHREPPAPTAAISDSTDRGYVLPNAAVHDLPSTISNRRYQVWVDVPASYARNNKLFPMAFVTDANYSFLMTKIT